MSSLVSICIPTYNRCDRVIKAVESALGQTYEMIEVIVSDNGSDCDVISALSMYPSVVVLREEVNRGMNANWNKCIDAANGDYVILLSDDDLLHPTMVTELLEGLIVNSCSIAYGLTSNQTSTGFEFIESGEAFVNEYLSSNRVVFPSACLVERKLLVDIDGYPEVGNALDVASLLMMASKASAIYAANKVLCEYAIHEGNDTFQLSSLESKFLLEKFLISNLSRSLTKKIRYYVRRGIVYWCLSAFKRGDFKSGFIGLMKFVKKNSHEGRR